MLICKQSYFTRGKRVALSFWLMLLMIMTTSNAQASMLPENFVDFSGIKFLGKDSKIMRSKIEIKIEDNNKNNKILTRSNQIIILKKEKSGPKEVEKAAEYASKKTGVRKEFLMGMLTVESDLGRNTGKCTYREVEEGARKLHNRGMLSNTAWNTFLRRREIIKNVAREVGRDYEKLHVSCNPTNYTGTGGAMGIPQFMPDTWMEYKERLTHVLNKNNPDPWNATDGVMAMALKLADVPGVTNHNYWAEKNAAKLYLSGTTSWRYNWYADSVQYWAQNYTRKFQG